MNVTYRVDKEILYIAVEGRIDASNAAEAEEKIFEQFPATLNVDLPGTYALTQTTDFGKKIEENVYVKIPSAESNVREVKDALAEPYIEEKKVKLYDDLLLYFAATLVALLFIEWWLQSRENM